MRKIISLIHMSLDGFAAGPNGEIDWVVYNPQIEQMGHELHNTTDAAIYGRVTYQMMANYWPTVLADPTSDEGARNHARWLETATKIVVSRTMTGTTWDKSLLIRDNIAEEIGKLKRQPGKDMWLLGSPTLTQTLMHLGLIDEYRINLNPVVLGRGMPYFGSPEAARSLRLLDSRALEGGVVALRYVPAGA